MTALMRGIYNRFHCFFLEGRDIGIEHFEVVIDDLDEVRPVSGSLCDEPGCVLWINQRWNFTPLGTM